jgi:hypothetical protein
LSRQAASEAPKRDNRGVSARGARAGHAECSPTTEETVSKRTVGGIGCLAVILAVLIGGAPLFGWEVLFPSSLPSSWIWPCWLLGLALFILGTGCGMKAWATLPGKVAAIAGLALGIPFAGLLFYAKFIFSLEM